MQDEAVPSLGDSRKRGFLSALACAILCAPALFTAASATAQTYAPYTFPAWQPLNTTASGTVTVTATAPGTVSSIQVLTQGNSALEFADAGGNCNGANFTAVGQTCTESVTFTPHFPGIQYGAVVALASGGTSVLGTGFLSGVGKGPLALLIPGELTTIAGSGEWKVIQNGPALNAGLYLPTSIARDSAGDIYIADSLHNMIRKVDTTQTMSTVAGTGPSSYTGDNGPAANATLYTPSGIAIDGAGNLYIADTGNNAVREIMQASGIIRTVAGTGVAGNTGDGGPATAATLNQPLGVTVDRGGALFISDSGNNRIRRVDPVWGTITNVAGSPAGTAGYSGDGGAATSALLNGPNAVAFDLNGNMFIPDSLNNVVRLVQTSGSISTFAGGGTTPIQYGPSATAAQLNLPSAVILDPGQNVYIADTQNEAIRKVYAYSGYFTTFTEMNVAGDFFNGKIYQESLYGPGGFAMDGNGNLIFADEFNNRIREVQSNLAILDFTEIPTHLGDTSAAQNEYLENDGNDLLTISSITADANAAIDTTVANSCVTGGAGYGPIAGCEIAAEFKPSTTGSPLTAHITIDSNSVNQPHDIQLVGNAIPPSNTTTTLTTAPNPSLYEQNVVMTATVAAVPASGTTQTNLGIPQGTVTFTSDGAPIGTGALDSTGRATLNYTGLPVGTHSIVASYGGANDYLVSTSNTVSQVVQLMPTVTSLGNSASSGTTSAVLVATVIGTTSQTPIPTGTVTFVDGTTTIGTAVLNSSGVATLNPQLGNSTYTIIANYSGDAVHAPSSSAVISITGNPTFFDLTVNPSKLSLKTGQNATVGVSIVSTNTASDTIGLGCASLPAGVNCHFSSDSVSLGAGATQIVQLTIDTNNPLSGGASAMNAARSGRPTYLAGLFAPAALFFGFAFWRLRKRHAFIVGIFLALLTSGAFVLSGCGGSFSQSTAAPGTYTFQVTGLGVSSNAAHYQDVTLTITK